MWYQVFHSIVDAIERGYKLAVATVPKSVDNDIPLIDKSFGADTVVAEAVRPIHCAHTEARSVPNGVGLVRLMGRNSGYIACQAAKAAHDANFVILPEVSSSHPALWNVNNTFCR